MHIDENIEEKLNYDLAEQCSEFSYSLDNIPNGVDVTVTYDNNKNYVVEKMMLAVSPCLLQRLSTYEENQLKKNQNIQAYLLLIESSEQ